MTAPAEISVGAGDTARVIVHVCGADAVDLNCHPTSLVTPSPQAPPTSKPPEQPPLGSTITARLNSRNHVAIDSRSPAMQLVPTKADSLTWEWLATPDAIGQWEISLTVTGAGSSPDGDRTMTIKVNAYRSENHCHPGF